MRAWSGMLILLLAGCGAYAPDPYHAPQTQAVTAGPVGDVGLPTDSNGCSLIFRLRPGESFTPTETVFAQADGNALMLLDGSVVEFVRTMTGSDTVDGIPTVQTFTSPTLDAKLVVRQGDSKEEAPMRAVLRLTKPNGWSTVIALSGGRQCR